MEVELYVPEGTKIVDPKAGMLDEPDYEHEGRNLAWILYQMVNSDGITEVVNRACDLYNENDDYGIDKKKFRYCINRVCRSMVIDYLEETNQV